MKQNNIWRRAVALLCALVMMVTGVPLANAAETTGPTITVSTPTVSQGGTAYVYVYGKNLENLGALQFSLTYDETVFTVTSATGSNMEVANVNTATAGQVKFSGMDSAGVTSSSIQLMRVGLRAASDAEIGTYSLGLTVGIAVDTSSNGITFAKEPSTITVRKAEPLKATFSGSVSPSTVEAGETVTYTLSSYNLGGMATGQFSFTYDSDLLTFQSASLLSGLDLEGCICSVNSNNPGLVTISWAAAQGTAKTGQLLKLTFQAVETASGKASITFTPMTLSSEDKQAITATAVTTNLTITEKQVVETDPAFWLKVPEVTQTNAPFTVIAAVEGRSGLAAADFSVSYDTNVLECLSVEAVSDLDEAATVIINPNQSNGLIQFSLMCNGGISEDMDLVAITFQAKENRAVSTTLTTSVFKPINDDRVVLSLDCQPADLFISVPSFTVTFLDHDGTELDVQSVPYLSSATDPAVGGKEHTATVHYVHNGWDTDFSSIEEDLTVTAQYEAIQHSFETWTPLDDDSHISVCTGCTATDTQKHTAVDTAGKEPTCTTTGLTAGTKCSVCGKVLSAQKELAALGHSYKVTETREPTCTEKGYTTYTCSICGDHYVDSYVGPKGHTEVTVTGKAATCTESGLTNGVKCSDCGEIITAQQTIPAKGHTDGNEDAACDICGAELALGPMCFHVCAICGGCTDGTCSSAPKCDCGAGESLETEVIGTEVQPNLSTEEKTVVLVITQVTLPSTETGASQTTVNPYEQHILDSFEGLAVENVFDIRLQIQETGEDHELEDGETVSVSLNVGVENAKAIADGTMFLVHLKDGAQIYYGMGDGMMDLAVNNTTGVITFTTNGFSPFVLVSQPEDQTITMDAVGAVNSTTVTMSANAGFNCNLYIAAYDADGRMLAVTVAEGCNLAAKPEVTLTYEGTADCVKAFLLEPGTFAPKDVAAVDSDLAA